MGELYLISLNKNTCAIGVAEEAGGYMKTGCHKINCKNAIDAGTGKEIICDHCRFNPKVRSNDLFKKKYFEEII